jgi:hypothetical protein
VVVQSVKVQQDDERRRHRSHPQLANAAGLQSLIPGLERVAGQESPSAAEMPVASPVAWAASAGDHPRRETPTASRTKTDGLNTDFTGRPRLAGSS